MPENTTRIKFNPFYNEGPCWHAMSGTLWEPGDERDIDNNETILVPFGDDMVRVRMVDEYLANANFVIADSGKNPNFTCSRCGKDAFDEATFHPKSGATIPLEIDGKHVCLQCFEDAPKNIHPDSIEIISEE